MSKKNWKHDIFPFRFASKLQYLAIEMYSNAKYRFFKCKPSYIYISRNSLFNEEVMLYSFKNTEIKYIHCPIPNILIFSPHAFIFQKELHSFLHTFDAIYRCLMDFYC